MVEQHHMRQFLLFVFALLVPCFVLWTVASGLLATPAIGLADLILTHWFPDVVHAMYLNGTQAVLLTEFGEQGGQQIPLDEAEYRLGFQMNTRILSYSLPFYTALHFATQKQDYLKGYIWGLLTLYPLFVVGLVCIAMKELMVGLGENFFGQVGVFVPDSNVIGILYQLSVLIVPTLAPSMLWLWQSKDAPLLQTAFGEQFKAAPPE